MHIDPINCYVKPFYRDVYIISGYDSYLQTSTYFFKSTDIAKLTGCHRGSVGDFLSQYKNISDISMLLYQNNLTNKKFDPLFAPAHISSKYQMISIYGVMRFIRKLYAHNNRMNFNKKLTSNFKCRIIDNFKPVTYKNSVYINDSSRTLYKITRIKQELTALSRKVDILKRGEK